MNSITPSNIHHKDRKENTHSASKYLIALAAFSLSVLAAAGLSTQGASFPSIAFASAAESPDNGINWYDKALSVNQNNVPALVEKGTDLLNQGNAEQAITWLDKALNIDSNNIMALTSKGAALRASGQYQQAIMLYDKVLTIDPNDVYAIGGKADSLYSTGHHQQAIILIDKALELNPSDGKIQQVKESLQQSIN
jgi:tetratricopeptide (TPR) repeat protein